jgi:hypothetical protein
MKTKDFYNLEDAQRYLGHCVFRLNNEPIYVVSTTKSKNKKSQNKYVVKYIPLQGDKKLQKTINTGHKHFNLHPVPLGFLSTDANSKMASIYLARSPQRAQHLGICTDNLTHFLLKDFQYPKSLPKYTPSFWYSKELGRTIKGEYISLHEAIALSRAQGTLFPFSRRFAVLNDKLYYKWFNEPVGTIEHDQPRLKEESGVLAEQLAEDLNG